MLLITSVVLCGILLWNIIVRKNWFTPLIFWCAIWLLSTFFVWLNPFGMIEISEKAILIMNLGIFSFVIGTYNVTGRRFTVRIAGKKAKLWDAGSFNPLISYGLLLVTSLFNFVLTIAALNMLRGGMEYSRIRDVLFGYDDIGTSFFASSFMSTFYSWIVAPGMSVLLIVLLLNLFNKQLPQIFNIFTLLDLTMYIFSSSGRMLLFHAVVFLYFIYKYYNFEIPRRYKRKLVYGIIIGILFLLIITFYRTKDDAAVPSLYSYFSIDYPLFSYWINYVDTQGKFYYGNAFFRGILEGMNFVLGKFGLSTPYFWEMQEVFNLVQNKWIQVFPNNWYNAYVSCFFYFYLDFGAIGVFIGSYFFGKISSALYNVLRRKNTLRSLVVYMVMIQFIVDSFIRWRLGTFSGVVTLILAFFICTKRSHKKDF